MVKEKLIAQDDVRIDPIQDQEVTAIELPILETPFGIEHHPVGASHGAIRKLEPFPTSRPGINVQLERFGILPGNDHDVGPGVGQCAGQTAVQHAPGLVLPRPEPTKSVVSGTVDDLRLDPVEKLGLETPGGLEEGTAENDRMDGVAEDVEEDGVRRLFTAELPGEGDGADGTSESIARQPHPGQVQARLEFPVMSLGPVEGDGVDAGSGVGASSCRYPIQSAGGIPLGPRHGASILPGIRHASLR